MLEPLDALGTTWELLDEHAEPGYYRARLSSGITCELTVGPKSAVHRYTFPEHAVPELLSTSRWVASPFPTAPPCRCAPIFRHWDPA